MYSYLLSFKRNNPLGCNGFKHFIVFVLNETDQDNLRCLADLECVEYTDFKLGLKDNDFFRVIGVSSHGSDEEQQQSMPSAPLKRSASSSGVLKR